MEYMELLRLRASVLRVFKEKFNMKNPNDSTYKNQALKLRLLSKYNQIEQTKLMIKLSNKEELNDILITINDYDNY